MYLCAVYISCSVATPTCVYRDLITGYAEGMLLSIHYTIGCNFNTL